MYVVATAGHVDHGKSTLLLALTGMQPDRWDEERERGLTIDLGFVWTTLDPPDGDGAAAGDQDAGDATAAGDGVTVAFVDVPGHERFVANMLAGAGAVPLALFVVAADDGWSAQSQEHLEILDLLGVGGAVVAVTKTAVTGPDRALEVGADVEQRLAGTSLAGAPVVLTDAVAGEGLDELRAVLRARLLASPAVPDTGRARLWVDRAFTIGGAGTVVTGTLAGGRLAVGDEVALLPGARSSRIRGLQALGAPIEMARPGSRVAVNLAGVGRDALGRGDLLVRGSPDDWVVTDTVDVTVRATATETVGRRGAWHLHVGSASTGIGVHPILGDDIPPGGTGPVRLVLEHPLPLQSGDRFVLREAGRQATCGGGEILDPRPPGRVRGTDARLARADALDTIAAARGAERLPALLTATGGARPRRAALAAVGLAPDAEPPAGVVVVGEHCCTTAAVDRWAAALLTACDTAGAGAATGGREGAGGTVPGASRRALTDAAVAAGCPPDLVGALLARLVDDGRLAQVGPTYTRPEHAADARAARDRRQEALVARLGADPLSPPALDDAARDAGLTPHDVQGLLQAGTVVRCGEIGFLRTAVDEAVDILRRLQAAVGPFTASQAREALGTSRKYAIPLLEHLDGTGATVFDGQHRTLRRG